MVTRPTDGRPRMCSCRSKLMQREYKMIVPSTKQVVMQIGYKMIAFPQLYDLVCYTARLPMFGQLLTLGGLILLTRRHETLHCIKTQLPAKNAHNMSLPPLLTHSQLRIICIGRRLPQRLLFFAWQKLSGLVWNAANFCDYHFCKTAKLTLHIGRLPGRQ